MAELDSNLDAVSLHIKGIIDSFNFTRKGDDQSLGRDLARKTAEGIEERSRNSKAPDGSNWDQNEPEHYAPWKRAKYGTDLPNVRTGQMLSLESLIGTVDVTPDEVTMKYGTGRAPQSASAGAISDADKAITDIEKAGYCSVTRPFYALDDTIKGEIVAVAEEALATHLRERA